MVPGFADLVKQKREELGWTQIHLANTAKVSPMCVSDLESKKRGLSLRTAMQIARALSIDVKLAEADAPAK